MAGAPIGKDGRPRNVPLPHSRNCPDYGSCPVCWLPLAEFADPPSSLFVSASHSKDSDIPGLAHQLAQR